MTDYDLLTEQILRDPGKPFRVGLVTAVNKGGRPPTISVEGRMMRYLQSAADINVGDTAVWGVNGATPFVVGKLSGSVAPPDVWHKIGTSNGVAFASGWANFSAGSASTDWTGGQYQLDANGWVRLKGLVNRAVASTNTLICTLPVGYRPAVDVEVAVLSNEVFNVLRIGANGQINILNFGSDVRWVNLHGIQFYAGTGTFADQANNLKVFPVNPAFNGYNIPNGQIPWYQRRDDGYIRFQGFANFPAAPIIQIGQMPSECATLRNQLFGYYNYTGSSSLYKRMDAYYLRSVQATTGTSGVGAAINFSNLHYWDITKDGDWTTLSLQNSWVQWGGDFRPPGYYKDRDGWVHFDGLMKSGSTTALSLVATLPVGYRPPQREMHSCYVSGDAMHRFDIMANGQIILGHTFSSNSFVSLNQIRFQATTAI